MSEQIKIVSEVVVEGLGSTLTLKKPIEFNVSSFTNKIHNNLSATFITFTNKDLDLEIFVIDESEFESELDAVIMFDYYFLNNAPRSQEQQIIFDKYYEYFEVKDNEQV